MEAGMNAFGRPAQHPHGSPWCLGLVATILLGSVATATAQITNPLAQGNQSGQPGNQGTPPTLPPTRVIGEPQQQGTLPPDQFSPQGPPGPPAESSFGPPGLGEGGRGADLIGVSPSASQGTINQQDIQARPLLRTSQV